MSICRYAIGDFASAHAGFEDALKFARNNKQSLADHRQLAELLNNVACLSYMCGQNGRAMELFEEALDEHSFVADKSLYVGSRFSGHTASLNVSVTKANIGIIALVTQDLSTSIAALETALKVSEC